MTKKITFTIWGNQEDRAGNPIPYHRSTQGGQWKPAVMRYNAWKSYVVAHYFDLLFPDKVIKTKDYGDARAKLSRKPIPKSDKKMRMDIAIYFVDKKHADSDNVFKGIADALFENDKYLAGSMDFFYSDRGRVDVSLTL